MNLLKEAITALRLTSGHQLTNSRVLSLMLDEPNPMRRSVLSGLLYTKTSRTNPPSQKKRRKTARQANAASPRYSFR